MLGNLAYVLFIDFESEENYDKKRKQIWMILFSEAFLSLILFILTLISFYKKSKKGSSSVIMIKEYHEYKLKMLEQGLVPTGPKTFKKMRKAKNLKYKFQLKKIFKRPYVLIIMLIFGISYGILLAMNTLMTQIITSIGYKEVK